MPGASLRKVTHIFHIKLELQRQKNSNFVHKQAYFERKTYIISCLQYFTQQQMQPGVMKRFTWATKVPQRIKTSAVVWKFGIKFTAWTNFAVNYCKNASFMNTEFIHDKHCVVIATTGKLCYEITVDWWQKLSIWKQKLVVCAQHGVFQH